MNTMIIIIITAWLWGVRILIILADIRTVSTMIPMMMMMVIVLRRRMITTTMTMMIPGRWQLAALGTITLTHSIVQAMMMVMMMPAVALIVTVHLAILTPILITIPPRQLAPIHALLLNQMEVIRQRLNIRPLLRIP